VQATSRSSIVTSVTCVTFDPAFSDQQSTHVPEVYMVVVQCITISRRRNRLLYSAHCLLKHLPPMCAHVPGRHPYSEPYHAVSHHNHLPCPLHSPFTTTLPTSSADRPQPPGTCREMGANILRLISSYVVPVAWAFTVPDPVAVAVAVSAGRLLRPSPAPATGVPLPSPSPGRGAGFQL
jgi:hypothetical protein